MANLFEAQKCKVWIMKFIFLTLKMVIMSSTIDKIGAQTCLTNQILLQNKNSINTKNFISVKIRILRSLKGINQFLIIEA